MTTTSTWTLSLILLAGNFSEARLPDVAQVLKMVESLGVGEVPPELVEVEAVPMGNLPWEVAKVRVLDRVPALELVLVKGEEEWIPTLLNKTFVVKSRRQISALVAKSAEMVNEAPRDAASDLVKILVDPSSRYGVLLHSPGEVPLADPLSDTYRDLKSQLGEKEAVEQMQRRVHESIGDLHLEVVCDDQGISFATWSFFGGEVARWRVRFKGRPRLTKEVVADRLGSWDQYY